MKVASHIQRTLVETGISPESEIYSLAGNPLPLWDQGIWDGDPGWKAILDPVRALLSASDGFVVISPEWHGQVPAGLKNFFLMCGRAEVGHKPALITTISSGDGGAYPVAELRMSSYKNNRICYIPEQLIIRNVEKVLNDDPTQNDPNADGYFRQRIEWSLKILASYAVALKGVRDSGVTASDMFKNGM